MALVGFSEKQMLRQSWEHRSLLQSNACERIRGEQRTAKGAIRPLCRLDKDSAHPMGRRANTAL